MTVSKQVWFRVHSFTGVMTGLMLFVITWSGSFAVISHELDWLTTPEMRSWGSGEYVSWGDTENSIIAAYPDAKVYFIEAPRNRLWAYQAVVSMPGYKKARHVYVDAYTGEVKGHRSRFAVWHFFGQFHAELFLSKFGEYFATSFALVLIASLASALIFYKRWWRQLLKLPSGQGRVFWSQLHKSVGVWSIPFIAIISITGLWYLYEHAWHDAGGPVNYVDTKPDGVITVPGPAAQPQQDPLPLDQAVAKAQAEWPEFRPKLIAYGWYSEHSTAVYLEGQTGFSLLRDRSNQIHVSPESGEVLWKNSGKDLPVYWVFSNLVDPLHFGYFGGIWTKIIYFMFGTALSGLILTGTWLHARRLARENGKASRYRWTGTNIATILAAGILLWSARGTVSDAREFGPTLDGVQQFPVLSAGATLVILGWIVGTAGLLLAWVLLLNRTSGMHLSRVRIDGLPLRTKVKLQK